jgi:hypothetical protein
VQVHDDVPFVAGAAVLHEIVVARPALMEDLPEDLKDLARVADGDVLATIAQGIEARMSGGAP